MNKVKQPSTDNASLAQQTFCVSWTHLVGASTPEAAAMLASGVLREHQHGAPIFSVKSEDGQVVMVDTENASTALDPKPPLSAQEEVQVLLVTLEASLQRLRQVATDPLSIRVTENIDIEIRPASEHDERVLVGCKNYGFTVVNYAADGLILDVVQEGDTESLWTGNFERSDLAADE